MKQAIPSDDYGFIVPFFSRLSNGLFGLFGQVFMLESLWMSKVCGTDYLYSARVPRTQSLTHMY